MTMYAKELKQFGLAKESVRGTAEAAPTHWCYVTPDSKIKHGVNIIEDPTAKGSKSDWPGFAGLLSDAGSIKFPLQISSIGRFIHMMAPGTPVATEQVTATITLNTNDKIDFTEDGGAEVTATLTAGTYAYGTASSQAGTLCALIKSCMEAAGGDPTYTVTYSYSTKKFTITKNSGVFVIKWLTGANTLIAADSVLGFTTADTSSGIAATSNSTTAQWAMQHVFTPSQDNEVQAYTAFCDYGVAIKKYNLCNASMIKLSRSPDQVINVEIPLIAKTEASGDIGTPAYTDESGVLSFQHDTFKIATVSNTTAIKQWEILPANGLMPIKVASQEQTITNLLAMKNGCEGSFTAYFESETERTKFLAGTETALEIDIQGATIAGAIKYRLDILMSYVQYKAYDFGEEDGLLVANASFRGLRAAPYVITLNNCVSAF